MSAHEPREIYSVEKSGGPDTFSTNQDSASDGGTVNHGSASQILNAIAALREEVAEIKASIQPNSSMDSNSASDKTTDGNAHDDEMDLELRLEVAQMVRTIAKAKNELAHIKHPNADDDRLEEASSELDAIVLATETATNNILEATETIEMDLTQIAALAHEDEDIVTLSDKIAAQTTAIMEACNFQDITGQRITKVVTTMQFVEERISKMIGIWGFDAFSELPVPMSATETSDDPDADLLAGPQMEGQGISQDEIDSLFD